MTNSLQNGRGLGIVPSRVLYSSGGYERKSGWLESAARPLRAAGGEFRTVRAESAAPSMESHEIEGDWAALKGSADLSDEMSGMAGPNR
jgi:hypothetical protein